MLGVAGKRTVSPCPFFTYHFIKTLSTAAISIGLALGHVAKFQKDAAVRKGQ
jgi:hypothetical protein